MADLAAELASLPLDLRERLARHHFDAARLIAFGERLAKDSLPSNRVTGSVEPPLPGDVWRLAEPGSAEHARLAKIGRDALGRGECALAVLAGGMATRMGGVVKALVEAAAGRSFLDLRLAEARTVEREVGRPLPLWLMTSHATEAPLVEALRARGAPPNVATFRQHLSLRLGPDGALFRDASGGPSEYAPGHGDLVEALRESGLLARFVEQGGRSVMVANLDNLGATVDAAVLGWHLDHGQAASCEVVDKLGADRGGIPVRHAGRCIVLEELRLPEGFDPGSVRVFNTNTFHLDARALLAQDMEFTWFVVKKDVGGRPALQLERLIGEVTSHLPTRFLHVPRTGAAARFLPVKDDAELEARRGEILEVARARGLL